MTLVKNKKQKTKNNSVMKNNIRQNKKKHKTLSDQGLRYPS